MDKEIMEERVQNQFNYCIIYQNYSKGMAQSENFMLVKRFLIDKFKEKYGEADKYLKERENNRLLS